LCKRRLFFNTIEAEKNILLEWLSVYIIHYFRNDDYFFYNLISFTTITQDLCITSKASTQENNVGKSMTNVNQNEQYQSLLSRNN